MADITLQIPQIGSPNSTEAPKIASDFTVLQTWANGNVDSANLAAAAAQSAAMNQSGQTVKGSALISASQSTSSTTYTTLGTPDQVTGVVLPTPGLLAIWYQATWSETVSGVASATLMLNGVSVQNTVGGLALSAVNVGIGGSHAGSSVIFGTGPSGLQSSPINTVGSYSGDATTGQVLAGTTAVGGPCHVFAAAGTYTVSVQFKVTSGSLTALNRRLYVQALSFA